MTVPQHGNCGLELVREQVDPIGAVTESTERKALSERRLESMKPRARRDHADPAGATALGTIERKEKSLASPIALGLDAERLAI
jgi:hypothetical protein